ncbi:MAG: ABC transporter ATP-binding protein [SAR202 cluster bacterium]|jgi:ATP-binding cassette subfamily F protein 3|nr:MAG: ABC transporter ATP-binding protein [SAR202 cluster bacterium]MCH2319238.1 ABC-F family ATP-binding cassette domain-containing protein [SAR202 cluster bacterium]
MAVIGASQLGLHYAEMEIFSDITLQVNEKARIGIVGPNGSGKTSLLRVLLGEQDYDKGDIFRSDHLRVGYVPQTAMQSGSGTLREQVTETFRHLMDLENQMAESALAIQQNKGTERKKSERIYSSLVDRYESEGGYDYHNAIERVVDGVGLSADILDTLTEDASGGERTRTALATALLGEPDLLVLDEPTNYLDFNGLEWLEGFLSTFRNAFIVVSHDRYFLDRVVTEIWEIDKTRMKSYPGNYSKYKILKSEEDERLSREYRKQQEHIRREESFIARYHAGQRSKEARGRARRLDKIDIIDAPTVEDTVAIRSSEASRTGEIVISTTGLKVGYADSDGKKVQLCEVPDVTINRGSTTAIIGNNGIGKTTLLKTLLSDIPALEGTSHLGHNVKTGYFRQGSDEIPPNLTVMEALLQIKNIPIGEARSFLARFLFKGEDTLDKVSSLSGGERGRLALARLLLLRPNVLVLDEPTTHLDIQSREALEEMLKDFKGTILFVSHDRHLISLLADNLWIIDNGKVDAFKGSYQEWQKYNNQKNVQSKVSKSELQDEKIRIPERSNPKKKKPKKKIQAKKEDIGPNREEIIDRLERRVQEIEMELNDSTAHSDLERIRKLGTEHSKLSAELQDALDQWGN